MDVRLPNGVLIRDVPDGTSKRAIADKAIAAGLAKPEDFREAAQPAATPEALPGPTEGMSGWQKFAAGYGKAGSDLMRGAEQFTRDTIGKHPLYGKLLPGDNDRRLADLKQQATDAKERDAALMGTGAGLAGNIVGSVVNTAPVVAIPGANTYAGSAAIGAGVGALQPVAEGENRIANTALGGLAGAAGKAIASGASRVLAPKTSAAAKKLIAEGVTPTPGQTAGGALKRIEEGATSVPGVGDFVRSGQRRAVEDFNKAAINRALKPLGKTFDDLGVEKVGREAVAAAQDTISKSYDDLLPKLKVAADDAFVKDLSFLDDLAKSLPKERYTQFSNILRKEVIDKFTPAGKMSGETMKQVESKVGQLAREYGASGDADQRLLGSALKEAQATLRGLVTRGNPEHAKTLKAINTAYANLLRVENAAARTGAREGVFSPSQLKAATRQMDASLRKRGFAHGGALMQDLAEAGEQVLGATVPDSGTPFRVANMAGLGAGYFLDPTFGASLGAAGAAYGTRGGQKLTLAMLAQRPDLIRALGGQVGRMGAPAAVLASQGAMQAR